MTDEPASPVCYAAQADDAYMGYASRDEIVALLNELLEAERAGARVAVASRKMADLPGWDGLWRLIRDDEAHWCALLGHHIGRLGGEASPQVGAFYDKTMAIAEPLARLAFLNRGQGWMARRLEQALPRIRDDRLHADLKEMARRHHDNIATAQAFLAANGLPPPPP